MENFRNIDKYAVICSLIGENDSEIIEQIREAESKGADGFILHIEHLNKKYQTKEYLTKIFSSTSLPIMALCYPLKKQRRNIKYHEKNAEILTLAVECGAKAVDVFAYMYDTRPEESLVGSKVSYAKAKPYEMTLNTDAIEKQKQFINKIHAMGADVLISAHVFVPLDYEELKDVYYDLKDRGADVVKIITNAFSYEQALDCLNSLKKLKQTILDPILLQCGGEWGRFTRFLAPLLGSCVMFCHTKYYKKSNKDKPLIDDFIKFKEIIKDIEI